MKKLKDLSYIAIIVLIIVLLIQLYIVYKDEDDSNILSFLDYNSDGVVTRSELKKYMELLEERKRKKKNNINNLKTTIFSGVARGLLTGLLLFDIEGGLVLGIISGILNPLIVNLENKI